MDTAFQKKWYLGFWWGSTNEQPKGPPLLSSKVKKVKVKVKDRKIRTT